MFEHARMHAYVGSVGSLFVQVLSVIKSNGMANIVF